MGLNADASVCSGVRAVFFAQASFIVKWLAASTHEAVLAVELRCHPRRVPDDYLLACLLVAVAAILGFHLGRCTQRRGFRPTPSVGAACGGRTIFDDDPRVSTPNACRATSVRC